MYRRETTFLEKDGRCPPQHNGSCSTPESAHGILGRKREREGAGLAGVRIRRASVSVVVVALVLVALAASGSGGEDPAEVVQGALAAQRAPQAEAGPSTQEAAARPAVEENRASSGAQTSTCGPPLGPDGGAREQRVGFRKLPAVSQGQEASFGNGLVAKVASVAEVDLAAFDVGETAGQGVAVRLEVRNDARHPIDMGGLVVSAADGNGTPAIPNSSAPASPMQGGVTPGATCSGVYAFRVTKETSGAMVLELQHNTSENILFIQL